VIAALSAWHDRHDAAAQALRGVTALPAHVLLEAYSVLTRLPAGLAVPAPAAADALARRFDAPPLRLDEADRRSVLTRLARTGIAGGSAYDGLVALEASAHDQVLLTLDARAESTYRRLGASFQAIAP
jgi:PIN domain-containing protein